jgi:hypothetical protein
MKATFTVDFEQERQTSDIRTSNKDPPRPGPCEMFLRAAFVFIAQVQLVRGLHMKIQLIVVRGTESDMHRVTTTITSPMEFTPLIG